MKDILKPILVAAMLAVVLITGSCANSNKAAESGTETAADSIPPVTKELPGDTITGTQDQGNQNN
jgi:archaellin